MGESAAHLSARCWETETGGVPPRGETGVLNFTNWRRGESRGVMDGVELQCDWALMDDTATLADWVPRALELLHEYTLTNMHICTHTPTLLFYIFLVHFFIFIFFQCCLLLPFWPL